MFGPGDYSHRIGKVGQVDDPEVVAARKHVAAVARRHGKFVMSSGLFQPFSDLVAEGHQVFNIGADVLALGPTPSSASNSSAARSTPCPPT
jgi:4-hydroxy-2-oxoheptanedioate aldolase